MSTRARRGLCNRPPPSSSLSALPKAVGAATHAGGCVGCSGEIERVKPKKDSTVIVVAGDDKGQTGTLYGIDGDVVLWPDGARDVLISVQDLLLLDRYTP